MGDADDDEDANDALPLLLLAENELHEEADRRIKSDTETMVGGRRIAIIVVAIVLLIACDLRLGKSACDVELLSVCCKREKKEETTEEAEVMMEGEVMARYVMCA